MQKVLTVFEAGEYLKVHPETIRRWAKQNKIPTYRAGRRVLLYEKDVQEFIEPHPQGATA